MSHMYNMHTLFGYCTCVDSSSQVGKNIKEYRFFDVSQHNRLIILLTTLNALPCEHV